MTMASGELRSFVLLVTGSFNMAATMNFVDPLRVANYLFGRRYRWSFQAREAGGVLASNGAKEATSVDSRYGSSSCRISSISSSHAICSVGPTQIYLSV